MAITGKGDFPLKSAWQLRRKKWTSPLPMQPIQNQSVTAQEAVFTDWLFEAATGGADGNATGSTVTTAVSIISGQATGAAATGGQTVSDNVTIISGTATGQASATGQVQSRSASILVGAATGSASAGGSIAAQTVSIISDAGTGGQGTATGQTVGSTIGIVSSNNPISADADVQGDLIVAIVSLIEGVATWQNTVGVSAGGFGSRSTRRGRGTVGKLTDEEWETARKAFAKARRKVREIQSKTSPKAVKQLPSAVSRETQAYLALASIDAIKAEAFKADAAQFYANEEDELMFVLALAA
jgi:hypothetical protein